MSQLSFFSADARSGVPGDLAGLLCGPGQVVRREGAARVSVVVADAWRVEALVAELAEQGLADEPVPAEGGTAVRTPFAPELLPLATRWAAGPAKKPPADLVLDGPAMRWWVLAAGRNDPLGFVLGLGPQDDAAWPGVGAALARAGLPGTFVGPRADGPAYRISGRRRLHRLAESVGAPPPNAPPGAWPRGPAS